MNREEAKELLPIIQAFAEGKPIEVRNCAIDDEWKETSFPSFEPPFDYRIKPEAKYRPFKDADECWNEMLKHEPFGWVTDKEGEYIFIVHLTGIGVCGGDDLEGFCYGSAIKVYRFIDDTPFGIKEGGEE